MQPDNNGATNGTFSGRAVIQGKVLSIKSNDFGTRSWWLSRRLALPLYPNSANVIPF